MNDNVRLRTLLKQESPSLNSQTDGVCISSRVRLARNVADQPFRRSLDREQQSTLTRHLLDICAQVLPSDEHLHLVMDEVPDTERKALVERFLVSPELAASRRSEAAVIARSEAYSAMINEEDHMRLQVLQPGFQLSKALSEAQRLDRNLEHHIKWAYHDQFGYLTSCPTNTGTGLRASVMLHLPALAETNELRNALRAIGKLHLAVRGLHGEGSEAVGHFYQVSNQRTLGTSEEDIVERLELVIRDLVNYEALARESLIEKRRFELEDKVFRAWGILTHARRLTNHELLEQLAWVRLGCATHMLPIRDWQVLDRIFLCSQSAHLQLRYHEADNGDERKKLRAELVRNWLLSASL